MRVRGFTNPFIGREPEGESRGTGRGSTDGKSLGLVIQPEAELLKEVRKKKQDEDRGPVNKGKNKKRFSESITGKRDTWTRSRNR